MNRRSFLLQSVSGMVALCNAPVALARACDISAEPDADASFAVLKNGDLVARLQLAELRESVVDARLQQFTLRFRAATSAMLEEACHELHHHRYGDMILYLQPGRQSRTYKEFSATVCLFAGERRPAGLPDIDELRSLIAV